MYIQIVDKLKIFLNFIKIIKTDFVENRQAYIIYIIYSIF